VAQGRAGSEEKMNLLFNFFIFPGFLFTAVLGMLAGWVDRKVTARIHYRVGPPWYQNFVDFYKLLGKEVIVPEGARFFFLLAPLLGLASAALVSMILGNSLFGLNKYGFTGDLIVVVYLLMIPAISVILGASASRNSLASLAASREMKLVLGYELPFILSILVVIIKTGSIRLAEILGYQASHGSLASLGQANFSGFIALLTAIFCMQAKLGLVPFDMAEAETEIAGGTLIEYSGPALAIFRLTRSFMIVIMPLFLVGLFWAGTVSVAALIGKYVALLVIVILIR
jgi:NADH-quinone oxidoreductase subunit H